MADSHGETSDEARGPPSRAVRLCSATLLTAGLLYAVPITAMLVRSAVSGFVWALFLIPSKSVLYGGLLIWLSREALRGERLRGAIALLVYLFPGAVLPAALLSWSWWGPGWGLAAGVLWGGVHGTALVATIVAHRTRKGTAP